MQYSATFNAVLDESDVLLRDTLEKKPLKLFSFLEKLRGLWKTRIPCLYDILLRTPKRRFLLLVSLWSFKDIWLKIFGSIFLGILSFVLITYVLVVYVTCFLRLKKISAARYRRTKSQIHEPQASRFSPVGFRYNVANESINPIPPEPSAVATSVAFVTDVANSTSA